MGRRRHLTRSMLGASILLAWSCMAPAQALQARTQDAATVATLSYGPVLTLRGQSGADTIRKDPAEVRAETDTLARQAPPAPMPQARQPQTQLTDPQGGQQGGQQRNEARDEARDEARIKQLQEQRRRAARRHPAWQGEGPMAPRPLHAGDVAPAPAAVPIPPPLPAPQPVVPSSSAVRACQGIVCTDAAGNTFNGSGNAGVGSSGRVCTRNGATVQCF